MTSNHPDGITMQDHEDLQLAIDALKKEMETRIGALCFEYLVKRPMERAIGKMISGPATGGIVSADAFPAAGFFGERAHAQIIPLTRTPKA